MIARRRAVAGVVAFGLATACARQAVDSPRAPAPSRSREIVPPVDTTDAADAATARPLPLVPWPTRVSMTGGTRALPASPRICAAASEGADVARIAAYLAAAVHGSVAAAPCEVVIEQTAPAAADAPFSTEGARYALRVDAAATHLSAATARGLFYAAQTYIELAHGRSRLPLLQIDDAPRFAFRGLHLDVARHFFGRDEVLRLLDLMALYKLDALHLHLTDDQGFRIEIKSHPELTAVGAVRAGDATPKYFSQDDVRAIVAYAQDRFITVIPEIEMPGHARALLASHPELSCQGQALPVPTTWGIFDDVLCAGNDGAFALLDDVIGEVATLFPGPYLHLGGDEVPTTKWSACLKCRARMKAEKLTRPSQLGRYFMARASATARARGKTVIAWDEAFDAGISPDAAVMAWRGGNVGERAAKAGHDVVFVPNDILYFNLGQSGMKEEPGWEATLPWTQVLAYDPMLNLTGLDAAGRSHVLGVEAALWSELAETRADLDLLLFPRTSAMAEIAWSPPPSGDRPPFAERFRDHARLLDARGVAWFVDPPTGLPPRHVFLGESQLVLSPPPLLPGGLVRYTLDGSTPTAQSPLWQSPVTLRETTTVAARTFEPGGRASYVVRGIVEKGAVRPADAVAKLEPGVAISYVEGLFDHADDVLAAKPLRTTNALMFSAAPAPLRARATEYALVYRGYIEAPVEGVYTFAVTSDDGSVLDVGGTRIVDNEGSHAARERTGESALAAGLHPFVLIYVQRHGGASLDVALSGPGLSRRLLTAPMLLRAPR